MDDRHDADRRSDSWPASRLDPTSVSDLAGWFSRRNTVRTFDPDAEIAEEDLRAIVDAGRKAPTSGTIQMYSFVQITEPEIRERIHEACGWGQPQVEESSHFLLACIDLRRVRFLHEYRGLSFEMTPTAALLKGAVDASLAAQGVMTVAESRGYGVCPIGAIGNRLTDVIDVVDLPAGVLPIWGICIGVPLDGGPDRQTPRVPLETVLHEDSYEDPSDELLEACYTAMNERYDPDSGRVWEGTLANYWRKRPDGAMNEQESVLLEAMRKQGFFAYQGIDEDRSA